MPHGCIAGAKTCRTAVAVSGVWVRYRCGRGDVVKMNRSRKATCRLCDRQIISTGVNFTGGNLVINLPDGVYMRGCKYCIVVAQSIPAVTTINAPVYFTIGADTAMYPLLRCNCNQATACQIRSRTQYSVCVDTTATGGSFRMLGKLPCAPSNALQSLPAVAEGDDA